MEMKIFGLFLPCKTSSESFSLTHMLTSLIYTRKGLHSQSIYYMSMGASHSGQLINKEPSGEHVRYRILAALVKQRSRISLLLRTFSFF